MLSPLKIAYVSIALILALFLAVSVVLPLYFLKWKKDRDSVSAGTGIRTIVQLQVIPQTFCCAFYTPKQISPFETDSNGVAYTTTATTTNLRLTTSVTKTTLTSSTLHWIVNSQSSPWYNTWYIDAQQKSAWNPMQLFDPRVSVATESQINAMGVHNLSKTNSNGSFYLSDDGYSIKVGRIDSNGKLETMPNIPTTTDLTKVPNNWFLVGDSDYGIMDYIWSPPGWAASFSGPFTFTLSNLSSTYIDNTTFSDIYFWVRVPKQFSMYLFATATDLAGSSPAASAGEQNFPLKKLTDTNALINGWTILSHAEASLVMTYNTTFSTIYKPFKTCLQTTDSSGNSIVQLYQQSSLATDPVFVPTLGGGFINGVQDFWIVKAPSRQTVVPLPNAIFDFSVIMGTLPVELPPLSNPIVSSTDPADGIVTTVNTTTGQVTVSKEGTAATTITKEIDHKSIDYKSIYIYISVGVAASLILAAVAVFLSWKYIPNALE